MSVWQRPGSPYPPTPRVLDHRARPEQVLRFVLDAVEAQSGEGIFFGYGRWAKRLMGKVVGMLPAGYQGQIVTLDTSTGLSGHVPP